MIQGYTLMSDVGDLVARELEKRGKSQRWLALQSGKTNTAISDLISGKTKNPTHDLLIGIARALGIRPEVLYAAAGYMDLVNLQSAEEKRTVKIIGHISGGPPILAVQEPDGELEVTQELLSAGVEYGLRVHGDSMAPLGIVDGAIVLVRPTQQVDQGTIAVVIDDDSEATVKEVRYHNGKVVLHSANPIYEDRILSHDAVQVLGEVVEVVIPIKRMTRR